MESRGLFLSGFDFSHNVCEGHVETKVFGWMTNPLRNKHPLSRATELLEISFSKLYKTF